MKKRSQKSIDAELWVDQFIEKHHYPPTYYDVAVQFGIARTSAYHRCKDFRIKMNENDPATKAEKRLRESGVGIEMNFVGQRVFVLSREGDNFLQFKGIKPMEWTVEQLRAMADYMEAFPECSRFRDGSGQNVRLK